MKAFSSILNRIKSLDLSIATVVLGLIILFAANVFAGALGFFLTFRSQGILAPFGQAIAVFGLLIPAAVMLWFGLTKPVRHRSWAAAPIIYLALQFGYAVVARANLQFKLTADLYAVQIPAIAREQRTVIDDAERGAMSVVALAYGKFDRLVEVRRSTRGGAIEKITEWTIGIADACTKELKDRSTVLRAAGRPQECFIERQLNTVPDGLIFTSKEHIDYRSIGRGCCHELQIGLRKGEATSHLASWFSGTAVVPRYLPVPGHFESMFPSSSPWGWSPYIRIGKPGTHFSPNHALQDIYGIDTTKPLRPHDATGDQLANLAIRNSLDPDNKIRRTALSLALEAKAAGTENMEYLLRAVTNYIGNDAFYDDPNVGSFVSKLNAEERSKFYDLLFERLSKPAACGNCYGSDTVYPRDPDQAQGARAEKAFNLFETTGNLDAWQYEALLRLAGEPFGGGDMPVRRRLFQAVASDPGTFSQRAMAFSRVYVLLSATEATELAKHFDLVSDDKLDAFLFNVHPNNSPGANPEAKEAARRFYKAARDRLLTVTDERKRHQITSSRIPKEFSN